MDRKLGRLILGVALAAMVCTAAAAPRPATDAEIELVRASMLTRLKDAESARFTDVRVSDVPTSTGMFSLCGKVNAKNAMGGYVGYSDFIGFLIPANAAEKREKPVVVVIGIDSRGLGHVANQCRKEGL